MHCEQAETFLAALIYGQLDTKPKAALLEHLATCMKCSALLAGMRSVSGLLKEAVEAGQPPKLSRRRRAVLLRAAARSQEQKHVASTKMSAILEKIKSIFPTLTGPMQLRHLGGIAAGLVIVIVVAGTLMPSLGRARQSARRVAEQAPADAEIGAEWEDWEGGEDWGRGGDSDVGMEWEGPNEGEETEIVATTDNSGSMREGNAKAPQGTPPSNRTKWEFDFVVADDMDGGGGGGTAAESLAPGRVTYKSNSRWTKDGRDISKAKREEATRLPADRDVAKHVLEKYDRILNQQDTGTLVIGGMSGTTGGGKLTEEAEKARSGRAGARLPYSENLAEISKQPRPIAEIPTVLLKGYRGAPEEAEVPPLAITKGGGTLPGGKALGRLFDDRAQPDADEPRRSSNSYDKAEADNWKKQLARKPPPRAKTEAKKSGGPLGIFRGKRPAAVIAGIVSPKSGRPDAFGIPSEQAPWGQEAGVAVRGKRGDADASQTLRGTSSTHETGLLPHPRTGEVERDRRSNLNGEFGARVTWKTPPGGAAETSSVTRDRFDGPGFNEIGGLILNTEERIAQLVRDKDWAADTRRADEPDDAPAFVKLSAQEAQKQDAAKQANAPADDLTIHVKSKPELTVEEELPDDEPMPPAVFKAMPVNPFVMTGKDRFSTFALDVDTASYALARSYIRRGYLPPAGSVRMEEFVNAFDYNYPKHTENVFTVHAEGMPSPFGRGLVLLKIGVQGRALGREGRKPAHLVFVVDASGSMARPDRLPLVQHGLALLAAQLGERDRVSLVTFGSGATLLLQGAPAADKPRMLAAVNSIRCGGSTNLLQGVELGYGVAAREFRAGEINRVILCSDGVANIGLTDADDMLGQVEAFKKQGISFTSIGFGTGSYNDELLEKLANKGDGTYAFIASRSEARRVFVDQMATLQTIAGDAKIQVEFDPARVRRYRLVGYENRDVADKDFRNDAIDAGEVGSGQSATALYELELLGPAKGCKPRDLGTVYVRYRNLDTNKIEEISSRLESSLIRRQTVRATPRLYLAAAAAELAEILRQSEHAQGGSLDSVKSIVEHVAAELPLDQRVSELLNLATRARGLPRAQ